MSEFEQIHTEAPSTLREFSFLEQAPTKNRTKAMMALKGVSQKSVAVKYGLNVAEVSRVIAGRRKTPRIRRALAQELGVPEEILFGKRS